MARCQLVCRDCNHRLMSGCYCRSTPPHHHQRRRPAVTTVTPCWQRDRRLSGRRGRPNWARNQRHCASNNRSSFETPGTSARPSRVYLANREGTPPAMRAQCHGGARICPRTYERARARGPLRVGRGFQDHLIGWQTMRKKMRLCSPCFYLLLIGVAVHTELFRVSCLL